jgi:MFS family permease
MRVLAVIWLGAGCLLGSIEVVTIAYVSQLGYRGLTGFLLAGWALGSALAGLVYGALELRASRRRRLAIGIVTMWLVTFLLLLPLSLPALAVVLFISGLTIAPTLVTGFGMVEAVVPRSRLTEGMTWASTSLNLGATAGTAIAGWAVDHLGSQLAYTTSLAGGAVAVVAVGVGWRWLRAERDT